MGRRALEEYEEGDAYHFEVSDIYETAKNLGRALDDLIAENIEWVLRKHGLWDRDWEVVIPPTSDGVSWEAESESEEGSVLANLRVGFSIYDHSRREYIATGSAFGEMIIYPDEAAELIWLDVWVPKYLAKEVG